MMDAERPGRSLCEDAPLLLIPVRYLSDVGLRHELRRTQFERRILRKVEHLEKIELRTKYSIRVLMPALRRLWTLDAVVAGDDRQTDIAPQQ